MKDKIKDRINSLKEEYANGQQQLTQIEERARHLRETMLRIAGAIQVLEETALELEKEPAN